jgi:hypothetical protein
MIRTILLLAFGAVMFYPLVYGVCLWMQWSGNKLIEWGM